MLPETTAARRPNRTGSRVLRRRGAAPPSVARSRTGWLVIQAPTWLRSVQWSNAFAYDDAGNRTQWVKTAGSSLTYDYNYNSLNQLDHYTLGGYKYAFSYDANGNRTAMQILLNDTPTGYVKEYEWNEDDRLTRVTASLHGTPLKTVEYQYCRTCGGQRTGRIEYDEAEMVVEWLRYEMDGLNHLRIDEVYDADSNGELEDPSATGDAWRVQRVYVNGPGQLGQIAKVIVFTYASATTNTVASEEVYYYHYDILGNVSVISDPDGDEADQFEQDAFGNLVSGGWSTRIGSITDQITTKPYDADLGLYYFNARWYDPVVGAFVSTDKARSCQLYSNAYSFALGDPVNSVDPDGNFTVTTPCHRPLASMGVSAGGRPYPIYGSRRCECSNEQMDWMRNSIQKSCALVQTELAKSSLQKCIQYFCDTGKVNCRTCGVCAEKNPVTLGEAPPHFPLFGWAFEEAFGTPQSRCKKKGITLCANNIKVGSEVRKRIVCPGSIAVHEWGHCCGCKHPGYWWPNIDDYDSKGRCQKLPPSPGEVPSGQSDDRGWCQ